LRFAWIVLLLLAVAVVVTGCGGGGGEGSSSSSSSGSTGSGGEDLTARMGPEEQPDVNTEPLQFLYWRVDNMFELGDVDGDGRMDLDEFSGETYNFERMDANSDGFITKQEVVDDMVPVLRAKGTIP